MANNIGVFNYLFVSGVPVNPDAANVDIVPDNVNFNCSVLFNPSGNGTVSNLKSNAGLLYNPSGALYCQFYNVSLSGYAGMSTDGYAGAIISADTNTFMSLDPSGILIQDRNTSNLIHFDESGIQISPLGNLGLSGQVLMNVDGQGHADWFNVAGGGGSSSMGVSGELNVSDGSGGWIDTGSAIAGHDIININSVDAGLSGILINDTTNGNAFASDSSGVNILSALDLSMNAGTIWMNANLQIPVGELIMSQANTVYIDTCGTMTGSGIILNGPNSDNPGDDTNYSQSIQITDGLISINTPIGFPLCLNPGTSVSGMISGFYLTVGGVSGEIRATQPVLQNTSTTSISGTHALTAGQLQGGLLTNTASGSMTWQLPFGSGMTSVFNPGPYQNTWTCYVNNQNASLSGLTISGNTNFTFHGTVQTGSFTMKLVWSSGNSWICYS